MNKEIEEKISLNIFLLGIFIMGAFMCNDKYLSIVNYSYIPLIIIIIFLMHFKQKIKISSMHYIMGALFMLIILNLVRYNVAFETGIFLSYIIYVLMFLIFNSLKINEKEINYLINSYIISSAIISILIILNQKELNGWEGTYRYTLKFMNHVYIDPNFIGAFTSIGAIMAFYRFINKKDNRIKYGIILTIIISGIFMTGSRGAMVGTFCGIYILTTHKISLKKIIIIGFSLVVLIYAIYNFMPIDLYNRMFRQSYFDSSNMHRFNNWYMAIRAFLDKPIIGYGLVNTMTILYKVSGYTSAAHNTYIALTLQLGLVGFLLMLTVIVKMLKDIRILRIELLSAIWVSLLFTSILIEQNLSITFWIVLIISSLIIKCEKNKLIRKSIN